MKKKPAVKKKPAPKKKSAAKKILRKKVAVKKPAKKKLKPRLLTTREIAAVRAREQAEDANLSSLDQAQAGYVKTRREEADLPAEDPPEDGVDPTLPTNLVRGEAGHEVLTSSDEDEDDEDDEGRSVTEQMVDEGAREAEQDKVSRASRSGGKAR